jgi:large subunit ribosomal protein L25
MLSIEIKAVKRTDLGKAATKALRKDGMVPCALYGKGQAIHFAVESKQIAKAIYTPEVFLIRLDLGGGTVKALLSHTDFHPIHESLLHADFIRVYDDRPVEVALPVKLTGTSPGVLMGGKLVQKLRKITVKGIYTDMPEHLNVDISGLRLGRSLKTGDLAFDKLEITMVKNIPVASVEVTRALRQEAVAAAKGKK